MAIDLILPYTDMCTALHTQCFPSVCGINFTGDWGGIRTHDLRLTSADVLTSRPPSLPDAAGSAPRGHHCMNAEQFLFMNAEQNEFVADSDTIDENLCNDGSELSSYYISCSWNLYGNPK